MVLADRGAQHLQESMLLFSATFLPCLPASREASVVGTQSTAGVGQPASSLGSSETVLAGMSSSGCMTWLADPALDITDKGHRVRNALCCWP